MNVQQACSLLGIEIGASLEEAKKAFRKQAAKAHPDQGGSEEQFKKINEAYQFIEKNGTKENLNPFINFNQNKSESAFNEIFFGNFRRVNFNTRARRTEFGGNIKISFSQSILGCEVPVEISSISTCESCNGSGFEQADEKECSHCQGDGFYNDSDVKIKCSNCGGTGKTGRKSICKVCNGSGKSNKPKKISVKIPAGVDNGSNIKLSGVGNNGFDILFEINVIPDPNMLKKGIDVISIIEISLIDALKGIKKEVNTVKGSKNLVLKPGLKNKDAVRVKGFGVGGKGCHEFIVEVKYPDDTSELIKFLESQNGPEEIIGE
jgi:molecular chaperone DnaJ